MTVVQFAPRRCEGCGGELPPLSRPNRRYHDTACRSRGQRRRRREHVERQFSADADALALREAVEQATGEDRLLARLAAAANGGSVRACIYLLERLHGPGPRGALDDEPLQADELERLRRLHRRLEARR
jgi:hypothetical protein